MPDLSPADLKRALETAATFRDDPRGFALWAFQWGQGELSKWERPDDWQLTYLDELGHALRGERGEPLRLAVGAANGVGKSALVSILILWSMTTCAYTRGTVTANTALQLKTKTWAELAKWHRMSILSSLFDLQATSLTVSQHPQTWRIDAVPWSKERPEAIAGLHNEGRRVLLIFDEASGVDDVIWEYTEASTTDDNTEIIWAVFGNTTRNSGRFKECWGKFDTRWIKPNGPGIVNGKVDGRVAKSTNKKLIQQWAEDWGEDSDYFRVRVKAEFPRVGDMQYFPSDWLIEARRRVIENHQLQFTPAMIGVDVATGGTAFTVVTCRRGSKIMWQRKEQYTPDLMVLAGKIVDIVTVERNVAAVAIDANGVGKGLADRLSQLRTQDHRLPPIIHCYGAMQAADRIQFRNQRSELYSKFRDWLRQGSIPPELTSLIEQMEAVEGGYNAMMQMEIETKKQAVERSGMTLDCVDSAVLTFSDEPARAISVRHHKRPVQPATKWI